MFYLARAQSMTAGPTSPSADPIVAGALQGSDWSTDFEATSATRPG